MPKSAAKYINDIFSNTVDKLTIDDLVRGRVCQNSLGVYTGLVCERTKAYMRE